MTRGLCPVSRAQATTGSADVRAATGVLWHTRRMTERDLRRGLPFETQTYVCIHVFDRSKPVLYVTRPDGDWCALCGDDHPDHGSQYRVVGLGHVIEQDQTIAEVLDLPPDEEAERPGVGAVWVRSRF
jgi:hypothetical protein